MITFIILTKDNPEYLSKCLSHLRDQTWECWNAIVIDTSINHEKLNWEIIEGYKNVEHWPYVFENGFAAKNNFAIQQALLNKNCKYVCLLNDDAFVNPEFVKDMINAAAKYKDAYAFSPLYIYANQSDTIQVAGGGYFSNEFPCGENQMFAKASLSKLTPCEKDFIFKNSMELDFGYGAAIVYKREVFQKVGYLDDVFKHGFDEPDFAKRMKLKGMKIRYVPTIVHHVCGGSSANKKWYQNLNSILPATRCYYYFLLKHYPIDFALSKVVRQFKKSLSSPKSALLNIYSILWTIWMAQEARGLYHDLYDPPEPSKFEKEELKKKGTPWIKPKIPFKIKIMDMFTSYSFAIALITFCFIIFMIGAFFGWLK